METDAAIDMATATVSGDQIDVAFSRGFNEACDGAVEGQRGDLPQWCKSRRARFPLCELL